MQSALLQTIVARGWCESACAMSCLFTDVPNPTAHNGHVHVLDSVFMMGANAARSSQSDHCIVPFFLHNFPYQLPTDAV